MAKLNAGAAGFNAGTVQSRMLKISDIKIDPEISKVFTVQDKILEEIKGKMEKLGFDRSQPIVVWKGKNILLDGHTRLAAAKAIGLNEVPVAEKPFDTVEDAIMYTIERQVIRRNLTGAEILTAANMMKGGRKKKDGKGRAAEQLAEKLGVSPATIYAAQKINREASEKDKQAILNGEASIRAVHRKLLTKPKAATKPQENSKCLASIDQALDQLKLLSSYIDTIKKSDVPAKILFTAIQYLEKAQQSLM
jgi:ParB family chromosome partitioning protein